MTGCAKDTLQHCWEKKIFSLARSHFQIMNQEPKNIYVFSFLYFLKPILK